MANSRSLSAVNNIIITVLYSFYFILLKLKKKFNPFIGKIQLPVSIALYGINNHQGSEHNALKKYWVYIRLCA